MERFNTKLVHLLTQLERQAPGHEPLVEGVGMVKAFLDMKGMQTPMFYNTMKKAFEPHVKQAWNKDERLILDNKISLFSQVEFGKVYPSLTNAQKESNWSDLHALLTELGFASPFTAPVVAAVPVAAVPVAVAAPSAVTAAAVTTPVLSMESTMENIMSKLEKRQPLDALEQKMLMEYNQYLESKSQQKQQPAKEPSKDPSKEPSKQIDPSLNLNNSLGAMTSMFMNDLKKRESMAGLSPDPIQVPTFALGGSQGALMGSVENLMDKLLRDEKSAGDDEDDEDEDEEDDPAEDATAKAGDGKECVAMRILFNNALVETFFKIKKSGEAVYPMLTEAYAMMSRIHTADTKTEVFYDRFWEICQQYEYLDKTPCPVCKKEYVTKDVLPLLAKAPEGDKVYVCPNCKADIQLCYRRLLDPDMKKREQVILSNSIPELKVLDGASIYKEYNEKNAKILWKHFDRVYKLAGNVYQLKSGSMKGFGTLAGRILNKIKGSLPIASNGQVDASKINTESMFLAIADALGSKKRRQDIKKLVESFDDPRNFDQAMNMFKTFAPEQMGKVIEDKYQEVRGSS